MITSFFINGATGYITENCDQAELKEALITITSDSFYIEKSLANDFGICLLKKFKERKFVKNSALSDREIKIIRFICEEIQNNEIARLLNTSIDSIKHHRKTIYRKTSTNSSVALIRFALNNGII